MEKLFNGLTAKQYALKISRSHKGLHTGVTTGGYFISTLLCIDYQMKRNTLLIAYLNGRIVYRMRKPINHL